MKPISAARHRSPSLARASAFLLVALATGCAAHLRRFPATEPMWTDPDQRAFGPPPPSWYSPYFWDGVDNSSFRPLSEALALELDAEAVNVNALDEVPDSSWFTNRLSRHPLSPEALAAGACGDESPDTAGVDDDVRPPFTITRGKPDGSTPGFFVTDSLGRTYLMKPDLDVQPERSSAADAIGAAVFFASGYFTPCNRVVYVARDELTLDPDAVLRATDGTERPLTSERVDEMLANALTDGRGHIRASLSRFIEGEPISPWTYTGIWDEDPNDVVPHQHRRDVRAMFVLSAWLSHIDSRQENTMAAFIETSPGRGYVRHYMIDFSDTLGITYTDELMARRFGHSGYVDFQSLAEDFVSFGLLDRPWNHAALGEAGSTLGYFALERFEPEHWRPGYPNPAYERMTERDAAWMARILARFGDAHVRALVARGHFSRSIVSSELTRILIGRRDRILERWLTRLSPLTEPTVARDGRTVCFEDRAVSSGFRGASDRRYTARAWSLDPLRARSVALLDEPDGVCVALSPDPAGDASYLVLDVVAASRDAETTLPIRVHLYERGGQLTVAGLERLEHTEPPSP